MHKKNLTSTNYLGFNMQSSYQPTTLKPTHCYKRFTWFSNLHIFMDKENLIFSKHLIQN